MKNAIILCLELLLSGTLVLIGIVCCIFIIPAPLGIALIVLGGKIPQGRLKKMAEESERHILTTEAATREDRNKEILEAVTAVPDEELPWLI